MIQIVRFVHHLIQMYVQNANLVLFFMKILAILHALVAMKLILKVYNVKLYKLMEIVDLEMVQQILTQFMHISLSQ